MLIHKEIELLRQQIRDWHRHDQQIVLVPTMGNLHEGHLALVREAKSLGDKVVVTIFVNPSQFVAGEDFEHYPRTFEKDSELLNSEDVDLLFCPSRTSIYPNSHEGLCQISVPGLEDIYCGASRPGHFAGVATIVCKLFNLVQADIAVFGEKDFQQLLVIRKLVRDLNIPIQIESLPTIRAKDGLALSSRNQYLSVEERKIAPKLYQALQQMAEQILAGEKNFREIESKAKNSLEKAGFKTDYISICNHSDLAEIDDGNLVILAAAKLGNARLIDNISVKIE